MKTAIIFGASGQDGHYLTKLLQAQNITIKAVSRNGKDILGNVADFGFISGMVKKIKPDYIFHMAANSTTGHYALFENHDTIATGTLNILESVYKHAPQCKVFLSGSAMQFSNIGEPISEEIPFKASSVYAVHAFNLFMQADTIAMF